MADSSKDLGNAMGQTLSDALDYAFRSSSEESANGDPANIVDALFFVGRAIERLAASVERLGVNNAATNMGAIELLAMETRDGLARVAAAVESAAEAEE